MSRLLLVVLLLLPTFAVADDATAEPPDAAPAEEPPSPELQALLDSIAAVAVEDKGPFLWKAASKRKKHKGVVYVTGSIHLGRADLYPLHPAIEAAYAEADILAVEMDVADPAETAKMATRLQEVGRLPEGETLQGLVGDRYEELKQALWERGIPMVFVDPLRPMFVSMTLSMTEVMRAGWNPEMGIDKHFLERARQDGKTIVELEGIDRQLALFTDISLAAQTKMLLDTLDMVDATAAWTERAWAAVKAGDDAALLALEALESDDEDSEEAEEFDAAMLGDRNKEMVAKILDHVRGGEGVMLVVVGALHLPGEDGIVPLLAGTKGMRVERVRAE